jgi:outer membrane protein assembly factor BamD
MTRLLLIAAAMAAGALLGGCAAGTIPAVSSEGERLALARGSMEKREYGVAVELLKSYIANNAGSREVDEAIYRLGQCYLQMKEYASAQVEFERLLRDYPESDSSGSAAFRLGEALWGQTRPPDFDQDFTQKALDQWESYLRGYPDHWLAVQARARAAVARGRLATRLASVGMLYIKLRLPVPARAYLEKVTTEFGDTPQLAQARLGLALCLALEGRRVDAIEKLREFEQAYPGGALHERAVRERRRLERKRDG